VPYLGRSIPSLQLRLRTLTRTSSSPLRPGLIRLLLACGGLSLLLIGARGQSGALGHGEVMDGVVLRASAMVSSVAHAGTINEPPPILATASSVAGDNSFDSDDDDDGGDDGLFESHAQCHVTRSLKCKRITLIAPAFSRDFSNLPLRAPPV
jgi:hypothetical protein